VIAERAADLLRSRARHMATLRRQNTLLASTVLASGVAAGASTVTLKAPAGRLTGRAVAGALFSIAGIPGTCTVSEDAQTPASGVLEIAFTPALPPGASASTGAVVTFSQAYAEHTYPVVNREASVEDRKATEEGLTVQLLPYTEGRPVPEQGDLLDGVSIKRVGTVDADEGIAFFRCFVAEGTVRP
jgi:hypothetical protein